MRSKKKSKEIQAASKVQPTQSTMLTEALPSAYVPWLVVFALVLTLVAYLPALSAEFVNWDDQDYASNNQMIRSFSNFGKFFTTIVQGNLHPLTMISLAANYAISGSDPFSYHLVNVLFHLANVFLVYRFIHKLSYNNVFIAFTVAILFGVHPMHVESVAWVSERKDVLYTFFFLLGLISYLNYLDDDSKKQYALTFLWFVLSLASKPAAVVFPGVLFALDFYRRRKFSYRLIMEKIPMFTLSLALILYTIQQQSAAGATPNRVVYEFDKKIFFPFYGYMMYIYKMFWPMNLTAFYPLPPINEALSKAYTLSPLVFLATAYVSLKTWKVHREITFGFAFYLINLVLILQFFLVGSAIIAERYTYVPYIGLFFIIAWCMDQWLKLKQLTSYALIGGISLIFCFLSFKQAMTWQNTGALWDNAIENYPSAKAYTNRAYQHQQLKEYDKALELYQMSTKYNVIDEEVFFNMGLIYFNQGKDSLALENYNRSLRLKPENVDALNGRGSVYAKMGMNDLAHADFQKVQELKPGYSYAYKNRAAAYFLEKKYDEAIREYKEYLKIETKDAEGYSNLCVVYLNKGSNEEAIQYCKEAIKLDSTFRKAYINIGSAYINLKQYAEAIPFLEVAFKMDSTNEENLKFLSLCYFNLGEKEKAMSFFEISNRNRGK